MSRNFVKPNSNKSYITKNELKNNIETKTIIKKKKKTNTVETKEKNGKSN
jgi:hypothetical protein